MKRLLLPIAILLLASSCSKKSDDNNNVTPIIPKKGVIRFTNGSSNPYQIWVNNVHVFDLAGKTFWNDSLYSGTYSLEVIQISGYILYPTDITGSVTLQSGDSKEFIFP